ncbi:unnamed protein product [Acanthoscelides obtectus]|uniref:Uncharacterized protein n=1 Tax=Acanthoscelides obtectus TaxID=200917 RepID=A0A9P0MJX6_ACAOB|nr:unnamed protein product [Acanthoscelides obtectus]CAK1684350.1 Zinc finger protein 668 [Acanthoscelides obtectus]
MNFIIVDNCRLCQINIGTIPFENDNILQEQICSFFNIQVNDLSDCLPKNICSTCRDKLDEIQSFVKDVQRVNENLIALALDQKKFDIKEESEDAFPSMLDHPCSDNENSYELKCSKCPATFEDATDLKNHQISHDQPQGSQEDFRCPVCSKFYKRIRRLETHKRGHPEIYCASCDIVFDSTNERIGHLCILEKSEQNMLNEPSHCDICTQQFSDRQSYVAHLKNHGKYMCPRDGCCKILSSLKTLNKHSSVHDDKKHFLCGTCGKGFTTKKSLSCHEKLHLAVKQYRCKECNLSFSFRSNYRTHLRFYHEGFRFACTKCDKTFMTNISLERHERMHTGKKDFKCEQCAAEFFSKKELKKHFRCHVVSTPASI